LPGNRAFDDVAALLANLPEREAGVIDADAELNGDLKNLTLFVAVDVLVVVAAKLDLAHESRFDFVLGHERARVANGGAKGSSPRGGILFASGGL